VDRQPTASGPAAPGHAEPPRSVELAIRAAWALTGILGVTVVLMAIFDDQLAGAWARDHTGAREIFEQGGREGLERANYAVPSFVPVGVTMLVVGAMLVWVLSIVLRLGYRWGQLGLVALMVGCVYATVALGFVLAPPAVFVVVAVVCLLVEGVALACLWHPDTLAHVRGPWVTPADGESDAGRPETGAVAERSAPDQA
jgi:hypothetical protein